MKKNTIFPTKKISYFFKKHKVEKSKGKPPKATVYKGESLM